MGQNFPRHPGRAFNLGHAFLRTYVKIFTRSAFAQSVVELAKARRLREDIDDTGSESSLSSKQVTQQKPAMDKDQGPLAPATWPRYSPGLSKIPPKVDMTGGSRVSNDSRSDKDREHGKTRTSGCELEAGIAPASRHGTALNATAIPTRWETGKGEGCKEFTPTGDYAFREVFSGSVPDVRGPRFTKPAREGIDSEDTTSATGDESANVSGGWARVMKQGDPAPTSPCNANKNGHTLGVGCRPDATSALPAAVTAPKGSGPTAPVTECIRGCAVHHAKGIAESPLFGSFAASCTCGKEIEGTGQRIGDGVTEETGAIALETTVKDDERYCFDRSPEETKPLSPILSSEGGTVVDNEVAEGEGGSSKDNGVSRDNNSSHRGGNLRSVVKEFTVTGHSSSSVTPEPPVGGSLSTGLFTSGADPVQRGGVAVCLEEGPVFSYQSDASAAALSVEDCIVNTKGMVRSSLARRDLTRVLVGAKRDVHSPLALRMFVGAENSIASCDPDAAVDIIIIYLRGPERQKRRQREGNLCWRKN